MVIIQIELIKETSHCIVLKKNCLPFASIWVHPRFFGGVRVANFSFFIFLYSYLCYPIMCLYVLSSVLWCPLRFQHKNNVLFVSSCLFEGSYLVYVICVYLCIVVSNTYCAVFLFCLSLSCVHYVASFSGLSILDCPFSIL